MQGSRLHIGRLDRNTLRLVKVLSILDWLEAVLSANKVRLKAALVHFLLNVTVLLVHKPRLEFKSVGDRPCPNALTG